MNLPQKPDPIQWQHKIIFNDYSLTIAPEASYQQLGAAGIAIREMVRRVPFYAVAWSHEMISRDYMTVDQVAGFFGRRTHTIQNWLVAYKLIPKNGESPPHPDFSLSHYIAMTGLSPEEFAHDIKWIIAQEDRHGRIASVDKYLIYRDGGDPYAELIAPPASIVQHTGNRESLYTIVRGLKPNQQYQISISEIIPIPGNSGGDIG